MLELCRIHSERQSMYRQEIMEGEQDQPQQLLTKLGEIPIVSDTYTQVLNIYERTKGHNFLFRTSLGIAEYTAKAVAGKTVPVIYSGLQSQIDKVNDVACSQLEALEEKYPIITKPTEEVLREGQEQYNKVKPYVDPLMKPAKIAVDVGKTAVNVGTTVATTAMKPAVYAVNVGSAVTTAVVDTGKQAVSQVASGVVAQGQKVVDAGLSTGLGQFWMQQFDSALEASEKLVQTYVTEEDQDGEEKEEGEVAATRTERVRDLVKQIHTVLQQKADGDIVRYRMMVGNLTQEIMELTGFYMTLVKDGSSSAWKDRKDVLDACDRVWNRYAQFIPEAARPQDPLNRMVVLLSTLTDKMGELFSSSAAMKSMVTKQLSHRCQEFVSWCQQSSSSVKRKGQDVTQWSAQYISELSSYLPHMLELAQFLSDKVLDTFDIFGLAAKLRRQKVAEIPLEKKEEEIEMSEME